MSPKVAVVLLNWNGWRDTEECLNSLLSLSGISFNVIVVDNASSDDSIIRLTQWFERESLPLVTVHEGAEAENVSIAPPFALIKANCNGGFARGNNVGIRFAQRWDFDYVWLLNNDTVVEPDALFSMVKKMETDRGLGICGSILRYYDDKSIVQAVGGVKYDFIRAMGHQHCEGLPFDDPRVSMVRDEDLTYVAGASMLVRNDFLKDVGLMEESYFLYYEEIDWMVRSLGRWRFGFAAGSTVYHKEGGSIGTKSLKTRSLLSQYYLNRNLIRFSWLRKPSMLPIALTRVSKEILNCVLKGDFGRARTTMRAVFHGVTLRQGPVKGKI
jgi:hypothetical protein